MSLIRREKFNRYWKAGAVFGLVSSLIYTLLNYASSLFSSVPLQTIYKADGWSITIPQQIEWMIIIILYAGAVVTVVPWLYGRLIEVFHNKFVVEEKT